MLTKEQEEEARWLYIYSKLTDQEKNHVVKLDDARAALDKAKQTYENLQKNCTHPLIARETENKGNSGNWDRGDDSYWTNHKCILCDLRWVTGQDWQRVGGKLGHPDDELAKER